MPFRITGDRKAQKPLIQIGYVMEHKHLQHFSCYKIHPNRKPVHCIAEFTSTFSTDISNELLYPSKQNLAKQRSATYTYTNFVLVFEAQKQYSVHNCYYKVCRR
jgi:hypothetical protein